MTLFSVIDMLLRGYMWIIIARAVVSWFRPDPRHPAVNLLYSVTEPVLGPVRRRIPLVAGGVDFSPIIVIAGIMFLRYLLFSILV